MPQQTIGPLSGGLQAGEPISFHHIIGDILRIYPESAKIFEKYYGSACFSCPGQATESIRQSAMIHNVEETKVLADLNAVVRENSGKN
jgi:hybrid cluster-associated redox disulfide protein